jgi:DNA-binding IscR family transcriptional regulator
MGSNPVTVRKVLARLREAGFVHATRGPGAGWRLARAAATITLFDLHETLGEGPPFALHRNPPDFSCPVGGGVGETLDRVYAAAEAQMLRVLDRMTVEALLDDILRVNQGGKSQVDAVLGELAVGPPGELSENRLNPSGGGSPSP